MTSLVILMSLAVQSPDSKKSEKALPDDFKIVAQYAAGFSTWKSWKATIKGDGKVSQETFGWPESTMKDLKLSTEDVKDLLAAIKEAEFSELPKLKGALGVTDEDMMVLKVTAGGKTHKVSVYGYWESKDGSEKAELKRFAKVWREVLEKVPSPNAKQKPEQFDR
jgi:hypothetical protein